MWLLVSCRDMFSFLPLLFFSSRLDVLAEATTLLLLSPYIISQVHLYFFPCINLYTNFQRLLKYIITSAHGSHDPFSFFIFQIFFLLNTINKTPVTLHLKGLFALNREQHEANATLERPTPQKRAYPTERRGRAIRSRYSVLSRCLRACLSCLLACLFACPEYLPSLPVSLLTLFFPSPCSPRSSSPTLPIPSPAYKQYSPTC